MTDQLPAGDADTPAPFHAGERELQRRAGVHERVDKLGRVMIRDHLVDQHQGFFPLLTDLLLAATDANGDPCATMLAGPAGFAHAVDPGHLRIEALPAVTDPLHGRLTKGTPVGLLGLQAHTRRRNRMNGIVTAVDGGGVTVAVRQSFGNCPKYIQAREARWCDDAATAGAIVAGGAQLDNQARTLIARSDTFFVASSASSSADMTPAGGGLDVSHRGGKPGFVRLDTRADGDVLVVPDFVGNFLFNTLGNLLVHPRCGLLFVDYEDGGMLHVSGRAELDWDGNESRGFVGAERAWRVVVERSLWRPRALPLAWSSAEPAPQLATLGAWSSAHDRPTT